MEVLCLPSHQENLGIVVADALACDEQLLISNKVNIWREIEADGAAFMADETLAGAVANFEQWLKISPQEFQATKARTTRCFARRFHVQRAAERLPAILRGNAK
jgi:glycosyltransferase involved in cell wall biosynthesis